MAAHFFGTENQRNTTESESCAAFVREHLRLGAGNDWWEKAEGKIKRGLVQAPFFDLTPETGTSVEVEFRPPREANLVQLVGWVESKWYAS
jgi:hypothetical protein